MAINPDLITTIRVDQLADDTLGLTDLFPHTVGTQLKSATIQELVDLVATAVGVSGGVGYLPLAVTNGQQLPNVPANPSFFLCPAGTYLNINGFPNVVCTGQLNAVMSLTDHWVLAVEIPIVLSSFIQSVTGTAVDNTDTANPIINTPTLQAVLLVADRPIKEIEANYAFENADRSKYLLIKDVADLTLNANTLDANSELRVKIGIIGVASVNLILGAGVSVVIGNTDVGGGSTISLPAGSLVIIKQDSNSNIWYINIVSQIPTTATDLDALKRDGSNANSQVDLGAFKIKATDAEVMGVSKVVSGGGDIYFEVDVGTKTFSAGDLSGVVNNTKLVINAQVDLIDFTIFDLTNLKANGNQILTTANTTANLPESTDKNYQTDNQKLFNDATNSIQTQLDAKLSISNNKLKEVGSHSSVATAMTNITVTLATAQPDASYQVNITPTSLLASTAYYISAKSITTFTVTYATAVTGAINLDYTIYHN